MTGTILFSKQALFKTICVFCNHTKKMQSFWGYFLVIFSNFSVKKSTNQSFKQNDSHQLIYGNFCKTRMFQNLKKNKHSFFVYCDNEIIEYLVIWYILCIVIMK